jgi:hypothetical protein
MRGGIGRLTTALLFAAACGGGGTETPDADVPDAPPPTPDAAPMGTCFDEMVDLDNPAVGQHSGNQVLYMGTVRGGAGELQPLPGCTTGSTQNERAHKITATGRVRFRAHTAGMGTPNLDSVVYIRTACEDAASELVCNDNGIGVQSFVASPDLADGQTIFIIVDSAMNQPVALPQPYQLTVIADPVVSLGDPCDPSTVTNVCEGGTVCSVAGGAPICAAPLGGPTLTAVYATERENGASMEINISGSDPDGDVLQALTEFLDSTGAVIDFDGNGAGDVYNFATSPPIAGNLTINTHIELFGLSQATMNLMAGVRVHLVDSSGMMSASVDGPMYHPTLAGIGDACTFGDVDCMGELACMTTCAPPTSAVDACAAAEASTAISAPTTVTVTLAADQADNLAGSCFWDTEWGEQILKVTIPGPSSMRLTAHTDVAPSPDNLDSYVYLRSTCTDPETELGCNDDMGGSSVGSALASSLSVPLFPGTYYLVIDGSSETGGYTPYGDIGVQIEMTALLDPGAPCSTTGGAECAPGHICADLTGGSTYTCTSLAAMVAAECASAPVIVPGVAVTGSVTMMSTSLVDGSCRYAGPYPEQYHILNLAERSTVTATTAGSGTNYDTVVFFLDSCSSTGMEIPGACNDDIDVSAPNWRSSVTTTLEAGTYAIVVDMSSPSLPDGSGESPDPASYSLLVTAVPAP